MMKVRNAYFGLFGKFILFLHINDSKHFDIKWSALLSKVAMLWMAWMGVTFP